MDFTILMPCLNEEKTIGLCIDEAKKYMEENHIDGEILISDNGSRDDSVRIASLHGARVVKVADKGYGNALKCGINEAYGKYVIMGDCDYSYDFSDLGDFVRGMSDGYDMVLGNRYTGKMQKGSMPFWHKYFGVPVLSFLASLRYKTPVYDYHCGLRAVNKESYCKYEYVTSGMEYATEMIGVFAENNCSIKVVPINYRKDKRGSGSHLNSIKDGVRHLKVIFGGRD